MPLTFFFLKHVAKYKEKWFRVIYKLRKNKLNFTMLCWKISIKTRKIQKWSKSVWSKISELRRKN